MIMEKFNLAITQDTIVVTHVVLKISQSNIQQTVDSNRIWLELRKKTKPPFLLEP